MSRRVTGDLRSRVKRLIGAKLLFIWVRALVYLPTRALEAASLGFPVSHTSVGSLTFSWSMVPAEAMAGTARTAAAAAPMKANLDMGSAFKEVVRGAVEAGAKAAADPMVARMVTIESFILVSGVHSEGFIKEVRKTSNPFVQFPDFSIQLNDAVEASKKVKLPTSEDFPKEFTSNYHFPLRQLPITHLYLASSFDLGLFHHIPSTINFRTCELASFAMAAMEDFRTWCQKDLCSRMNWVGGCYSPSSSIQNKSKILFSNFIPQLSTFGVG